MPRKEKTMKTRTRRDDSGEAEVTTKKNTRRASTRSNQATQKNKKAKDSGSEDSGEGSDAYIEDGSDGEGDALSLDSDAIDDSDFDAPTKSGRKRKRVSASPKKKGATSPTKKRKRRPAEDEEDEEEMELADGQEVVGTVVEAPKTGRVPPGRISQNTFNFLTQLQDPDCNDRTWFKLREPVFRLAEKEWKDFIDAFTPLLAEADPQIPPLPPNDVVHRIYRDVRFSNDKTPYKTNFSASFSRSGRKGIFAGFKPGGGSMFAAGTWCPGKNELQTIRNHIARSSRRLRQLISAPAFVALFGEAAPLPKGGRRNIFGMDDELKVAPKGVDKNHKDIDLLKCRSFAVSLRFTDKQVLDPDFKEELKRIVKIVQPFVHGLNDMMTVEPQSDESDVEDGSDGEND